MRSIIVLAPAAASLAIIAACASAEDETPRADPSPPASLPDAGERDAELARDVDVPDTRLPDCSSAGWCITPFPDADLVFRDIWPLEDFAFAIGESRTEGVKVLEWKKSEGAWKYIDDRTQNSIGIGTFAGRIYAPNADEVYFTVGPARVYHGKRSPTPGGAWTWTSHALPDGIVGHTDDHGNPYYAVSGAMVTFGVWGTGADDVYAYYSNTIFHRDPSDGSWSPVHVADDLEADNEHIFFASIHGSGPNDIWLVGARDRTLPSQSTSGFHCPIVVRKSLAGWERVADGVVTNSSSAACAERPGMPRIGGEGGGWLTDIVPVSATEYLALHDSFEWGSLDKVNLTRIRITDDGYSFEQSVVPVQIAHPSAPNAVTSLWRRGSETWLTSWGLVLRGTDDGTYTVSTISRDGAPVNAPLYKIRGTSTQNLWAIGARHAYHKTTP